MKRTMTLAMAIALTAVVGASATNVLSRNAVGFIQVDVPSNGLVLVTVPFEPLEGSNNLETVIGDQLPSGSVAFLWDRAASSGAGAYVTAGRTRSGWSQADRILHRGEAFWLSVPAGSATGDVHTVFIKGEVPDSNNGSATTTLSNLNGIEAVGMSYPVDTVWTTTVLSTQLGSGDVIFVWDPATGYTTYGKTRSGWNTPADYVIKAGEAFWINASSTIDWEETKPYTWPE